MSYELQENMINLRPDRCEFAGAEFWTVNYTRTLASNNNPDYSFFLKHQHDINHLIILCSLSLSFHSPRLRNISHLLLAVTLILTRRNTPVAHHIWPL